MSLRYRREVDGLRTIAVIAVIVYHAEVQVGSGTLLKGGFFGVDVFFVISGFLITSLIIGELHDSGRFSILRFYERRARRLLPALLVVMLATLPCAWIILLPQQLSDFARSQLSSLFFVSNFYWYETLGDYGAEDALIKPFLHTWSLAVEEQYYIFFPLLMVAIYRWAKGHTLPILSAGLLASLAFSVWMTHRNAPFSFYMLPSRFWELLAGGLVANWLYIHPHHASQSVLQATMPPVGLGLIACSMIFVGFSSAHPGLITLLPVTGTVLIIWFANGRDIVTRILSTKLFVGIGLISYSLYLWHYPMFAFGRLWNTTPSDTQKLVWISLTFLLAMTSYFLVEKPFRNRKRLSLQIVAMSLAFLASIVIAVSLYWILSGGASWRLGYLERVLAPSWKAAVTQNGQKCHSGGGGRNPEFPLEESCVFEYYPGKPYLVALGDSHAGSLAEQLRMLAQRNGLNFIQLTSAGCNHVPGYWSEICQRRAEQVIEYLGQYPNSTIVYSARIPLFLEMELFVNESEEREDNYKPADRSLVERQQPTREAALIEALSSWVAAGHRLVIVYPVPEQGFSVAKKLFTRRPLIQSESQLPDLSTSLGSFHNRTRSSYEALDKVKGKDVLRVYPERHFCDVAADKCYASRGKDIFFAGDNHVSPLGARLIVDDIARGLGLVGSGQEGQ